MRAHLTAHHEGIHLRHHPIDGSAHDEDFATLAGFCCQLALNGHETLQIAAIERNQARPRCGWMARSTGVVQLKYSQPAVGGGSTSRPARSRMASISIGLKWTSAFSVFAA